MRKAYVALAALLLTGCSTIQRDPPPEVWDDMKRQGKFEMTTFEKLLKGGAQNDQRKYRTPHPSS